MSIKFYPESGGGTPDAGSVTNASVANNAAIAATKIADGSVTNAEFQRLDATSSIQTQLNAKAPSTGIDAAAIADGSVSSTEFQYINSLTSNAQTQLNSKLGALTTTSGALTSNTAMAADTITDAPGASISCTSGTWLILGYMQIQSTSSIAYCLMTIADGSNTDVAGTTGNAPGLNLSSSLTCGAVVTPGSTTTYKLRGQSSGGTIRKEGDNAGQVATRIIAIKLA